MSDTTIALNDAQVARDVLEELDADLASAADGITVTDHAGVVTLDGTVRSHAESLEAERAAGMAPGVVQVTNNLIVAP